MIYKVILIFTLLFVGILFSVFYCSQENYRHVRSRAPRSKRKLSRYNRRRYKLDRRDKRDKNLY